MKTVIAQSIRWNDIDRKFYKSLYEAFKDDYYLQLYYQSLNQTINIRGRHCKHHKKQ